mmetsp:Transcript_41106/g.57204  ORF Transcript_41106/g.57204 Transcript_41106/m.57204 type:complete len:241 (+) Transcript_41106:58-780(+)
MIVSMLSADVTEPLRKKAWIETNSSDTTLSTSSSNVTGTSRPSKVSAVSLPVEYDLMRLVENPPPSWSTDTPGCRWDRVRCNDKGDVILINWSGAMGEDTSKKLQGRLNVKYLPSELGNLSLQNNFLSGEFLFDQLPPKLEFINISINQFTGTPDFRHLPPFLVYLNMSDNRFHGHIEFDFVHENLRQMSLAFNAELEGFLKIRDELKNLYYTVARTKITVSNGVMVLNRPIGSVCGICG